MRGQWPRAFAPPLSLASWAMADKRQAMRGILVADVDAGVTGTALAFRRVPAPSSGVGRQAPHHCPYRSPGAALTASLCCLMPGGMPARHGERHKRA